MQSDDPNAQNQIRAELDKEIIKERENDPIYQYLSNPFIAENYIMGESIGEKGIELVIYINMNKPTGSHEEERADKYKAEAFNQIRKWGFDPDNYQIKTFYLDELEKLINNH